jgi:2'-5' RNA ligase
MKLSDPSQLALVLTFDPQTQTRLDHVIAGLEALGIAPFPEGLRVLAHVTLAAFTPPETGSSLPLEEAKHISLSSELLEALEKLAASTAPIAMRFDSIGAFNSSQGVIFLSPVLTRRLQELHLRVQAVLDRYQASFNPYYLPDQWVPHVTLAVEQPPEALPVIFRACQQAGAFTTGLAESLLLVEFPPPRQVAVYRLGDSKL